MKSKTSGGSITNDSEYVRDLVCRDQDIKSKLLELQGAVQEGLDVMTRVVSLILLLASSCAFAQLSEPHAVRDTVTGCVNVRDNPVSTASVEACLGAGSLVTVVDEVPFWHEITFDSIGRGWIAKKFIVPVPVPPISTSSTIPADAFLEVHFVDVGQGDAIWIQTHDDGVDGNGRLKVKAFSSMG